MHTMQPDPLLEETAASCRIASLAQLVARLAHALKQVSPHHPLPTIAHERLNHYGLVAARCAPEPEAEPEVDAGAGYADEAPCCMKPTTAN